jgi:hypothetical protein
MKRASTHDIGSPAGIGMRRSVVVIGLVLALLAFGSAAGRATPTNGANTEPMDLSCGGGSVTVFTLPGLSDPVWIDESGLAGTMYHAKSLDIRVYSGTLTTEPASRTSDPAFLFEIAHDWGERVGQANTVECSFVKHPAGITGFGDLELTTK